MSAPLQIVVSYSDQTAATYLGASQLSNSNGVTAVTICAAPAASTIRDIDMVTVLNTDTGSQVVTIQLLDTATTYKIISTTLLVGEKLTYTHGSAWQVLDNTGNLKTVVLSTSGVNSFSAGTTGLTPSTATTGAVTLGGTLAVASGGTGTSSPSLVAGTNVSITGTWPNQTVNSTATGSVTSVTATSPVASSGGATPDISLSVSYGDTQNPYASKTANYVLAAPNGSAGVPTFRALVTADIPALSYVSSVSGTSGNITSTGGLTPIIDLASGVIAAGTTGSVTAIPVITVDTYGRVTSITTAANPQGTVTSVTGTSPVVSSGGATPAISLATAYGDTLNPYASKTANYFLGAPNGSAGVPTFRALGTADIPALSYVTSVALSLPSIMSVSGSPVTSSGTLTGTLTTQSVNTLFAGPSSGAAAAPTFRSLTTADIPSLSYVTSVGATAPITSTGGLTPTIGVTAAALNKVDDTNVTMTLSGSPSTALIAATTMGLGWTGQLAVSRGGTGAATTTANFIFAGPSSGSPAAPTFRALTTADIPALAYGSVSSVALALPSIMSVSGSPVTSSGTLTGTLTTQAANAIFAGPSSGAAAAPTFRSLTTADIPALSYVTSVAATVPSFLSISGSPITSSGTLAISYSGTALPIANGGTGQTTASAAFNALSPVTTTGDLIIGNGTNSATRLAIGANNYVLTSNGTTATWAAATGGVTQIVAGTNVTISPVGGTGAVTINSSGGGGSAYSRTTFTATAGQTAFTVTYAVGYLQIYVNGVLLTDSDYTASSGTGFTLNVACAVGDIVEALVITTSVVGVTTGKAIAMAMIFGY